MGAQCQALHQHALRHLRHQRKGREKQHDVDQLLEKRGVHPLHKPGADAQRDGNGDEPDDDVRQAGDRVGTARHMTEGRQPHGKCTAAKLHNAEHIFIAIAVARVDDGQRTAAAKRTGDKPGADEVSRFLPREVSTNPFTAVAAMNTLRIAFSASSGR